MTLRYGSLFTGYGGLDAGVHPTPADPTLKLLVEHDPNRAIGYATELVYTEAGLQGTFVVDDRSAPPPEQYPTPTEGDSTMTRSSSRQAAKDSRTATTREDTQPQTSGEQDAPTTAQVDAVRERKRAQLED